VDCEQFHGDPKFKSVMTSKDFLYFCPKCKKMKSKASGPKRKSYEDFKQPKKNKKRFDPSHYNLYGANSNYDPNEFSNKSPNITDEINLYETALTTGNGNLADLKKVFYELPYIKQSGNSKKTANGHPPNEGNSYNSIDHLMASYGFFIKLKNNFFFISF